MTVRKADELWEAVLGDLQLQVTRPGYETWLKDTIGLAIDNGEFVVGTPNTFVAEMLEQRMYSLISQAVGRVVDGGVDIRFQVLPQGTQPHPHREAGGSPSEATANVTPNGRSAEAPDSPQRPSGTPATPTMFPQQDLVLQDRVRGPVQPNPRYTFQTFIVGKSNELAHAAAQAVSEKPGLTYNPLFIYSGVGLGKTHLLHAIGHRVHAQGLTLVYATTEQFTNEYIKAIREGKTEDFRTRYRSADVLLLDDIQFIIGKEQTQEGFFHTFNALHMATRQIVITSDRPAVALTLLEDRIRSRLAGGLVVDIQPPDLETRLAILRAKAEETSPRFPPDVLELLAERFHKNIRELEGSLNRVIAYAQLSGGEVNLTLVKKALADALDRTHTPRISDNQVLDAVSSYFGIDTETIIGRRRDKQTALARQMTMYLLREEVGLPYSNIGRILGGKDHTTALHACRRIQAQLNLDAHLRRDIINIREALVAT